MKKEINRASLEKIIQKIAIESGQLIESIQWEHESINESQLNDALKKIEENITLLKKILGE